jgi:hypothetical protein
MAFPLLALVFWERFNGDPRRALLFSVALSLLLVSYGLHCLRGRRFLPVKISFAACMILCLLTLDYFRIIVVWRDALVYEWLLAFAIMPFIPARPPLGPWWPAAKRTISMFRGDSREEDDRFKAKILASVKPVGTPQK